MLIYIDGTKLPMVNTVFRNLASVLPNTSSKMLVQKQIDQY